MKDIAIYGAGGFGREVACLIRIINESLDEPRWKVIGFFDDNPELKGTKNEYGTVLGGLDELNKWEKPLDIAIAIGNPQVVKKVAEGIANSNVEFPNIIAPKITFLDKENVQIGKGNIICSDCFISCNVSLGNFKVINGAVRFGHDVIIGNYNTIMPSCNLSGGIIMGDTNFLGVRSVILQYLKVGNNVRIGANSVMIRNAKDGVLYVGNPARKVEV